MLKKLIAGISEAFQTNNSPVLDGLHVFDPRYIRKRIDEAAAKDVGIVYDRYLISETDACDGLRKESAGLIVCARETFSNEFKSYSTPIEIKKI